MPINADAIIKARTFAKTFIPIGKYRLRFDEYTWKPNNFGQGQVFVAEFTVREIIWGSGALAVGDKCAWLRKVSRDEVFASLDESRLQGFLLALDAVGSPMPLVSFCGRDVYCVGQEVVSKTTGLKFTEHWWFKDREKMAAMSVFGTVAETIAPPEKAERSTPSLFGPRILDVD